MKLRIRGTLGKTYQGFLERLDRPGWKKFAAAMVALAVAFLLAIYSSVFAQEGRVVATGICASLALLLTGYVAVTAVPYLARRTRLEWLRVSVDYRLTREGWAFIALIFLLAIAGLNTGNNLLYIVMASLLAAILVSGVLSLGVLLGVELEVLLPEHVFARRPVQAHIRLQNRKRLLPSFSILLRGAGQGDETAKGKARRDTLPSQRHILPQPLYFPFLPATGTVTRVVDLEFPRRGLYREDGFTLSTRFPFGFLEKTLRLRVSQDVWVYPAVEPTEEFYEILPMLTGELEAFQRGRGHDLYSIRDMLPTDSARYVDWKASARTRSWKVREFAREDERRLQMVLDRRIGPFQPETLEQFEAGVEFCACLAWHFYEVDAQMQFLCGEFHTAPARAGDMVYEVLRFLAAVEPSPQLPQGPPPLPPDDNVFHIVLTAASRGSIPTTLWTRSYFIFFQNLKPAEPVVHSGGEMSRGVSVPQSASAQPASSQ